MKKILLASLLSGVATIALADSFQDFNNNLYAQYNLFSPNQGTYTNINNFGIGGTFQSKNNVWLNANAVAGQTIYNNSTFTDSNLDLKAGYAFQFFNGDTNGFQVIPYAMVNQATQNGTINGAQAQATWYSYGLGGKAEYRLLGSLKVSLDAAVLSTQQGLSSASNQQFGYAITPEVQYDINKTVMLAVGYTYSNSFNSQGNTFGTNGNSTVTAKVGYLF